ncbi:MAG: hypothetical protein ACRDOB_20000 [Streptosporangiaceae bacterium]
MSIKSKVAAAAGVVALVAGLSVAGTQTANAATRSCGPSCVDWFSAAFGTAEHPNLVLDVLRTVTRTGQPLVLARASGTNQGEDFVSTSVDPVSEYVQAGLVSAGLDPLYGNLFAFEIEYTPFGSQTGECVGIGLGNAILSEVTLQPCGVNSRTLWILDPVTAAAGSPVVLISGTTHSNFRHPLSLTVLNPSVHLYATALGTGPLSPRRHQLWGFVEGVLPS